MTLVGTWLATAVALLLLVAPLAKAQDYREGKVARVGLLATTSRDTTVGREEFRQALRDRGWVEGQNILVEERWAGGKVERFPNFSAELVRLKVDVIIAPSDLAALAAKNATTTIPIVMIASDDPVLGGFVASLGRPGGNITGLSRIPDVAIIGKQLQMLKTLVPNLSRVALLRHPDDPFAASALTEAERVARSLRIRLQAVDVRGRDEFENTFAAMTSDRTGAVLAMSGPLSPYRSRVAALAAKHRLPGIFQFRQWVEAGGLMSYGPDFVDLVRRAAIYVDKILKGAKPGDLPIEQPTAFELVINLKTARALGLTIPPSLLQQAIQVIE
jgi:putative ABC transport system substrate-binding protein